MKISRRKVEYFSSISVFSEISILERLLYYVSATHFRLFWHLTDFLMTLIGPSLCFPDSTCPSSCTEKVWENMIWLCPLFAWVWFTNWLTKMELFWPLYLPSLTTTLENIILNCLLFKIIFEFFPFFSRISVNSNGFSRVFARTFCKFQQIYAIFVPNSN